MTFAGARRHFARRERWLLAAVLLLAVVAHGTALLGEFVFDDIHSIAANWALQDPAHWWRWLSDPTAFSPSGAMYRPAVLLSLGLSFAIDSAPWIFKLGNVLLHALVAGLAFGWLRELGLLQRSAFAAAALFAVHPLVSEAVNLVSARSELLLFVGLLVALRAHRRAETGGRLPMALASVLGGTALACGSKETAVVLPALMLAQTVFLHRGSLRELRWRRALATVLPALALVLVYLLLRKVLLGEATVTLSGRGGGDPLSGSGRSLATQLFTMGLLLPQALLQMVVPVGLSLDPAVTFRSSCDALVAVGWGSVLLLAALALGAGRGRPLAGARRTGLALAAAVALPWIVIPLNVPLAEHRLYGPLLGLLAIVAPWLPRPGRRPLAFTGLLFVGVVLSNARALDYRDEVELWRQELAQHDTWRGHWGLGAAHIRRQEFAAAVPPLGEAWCRNPNHATLLRNYAEALTATPDAAADPFLALVVAERYLRARPEDPWARALAAQANLMAGRLLGEACYFEAAERHALSCLEVGAPKTFPFRLAAAAQNGRGDPAAALAHLDRCLALGLDHFSVRLMRAEALRALGRAADAQRELMLAQQMAPTEPSVLAALRAAAPR